MALYPHVVAVSAAEPAAAGLRLDQQVLASLRCRCSVISTAVVTPAERDEQEVHTLPPRVVRAQLTAALATPPAAVKVATLADADTVGVISAAARSGQLPHLVMYPLLASQVGRRPSLVAAYRRLVPHATVVVVDVEDAASLVGYPVGGLADMGGVCGQLAAQGPQVVVVTGGDLPGDDVVDVVWAGNGVRHLHGRRVAGARPRGAGSMFSTVIAAQLAHGQDPLTAVDYAKLYTANAIARCVSGDGDLVTALLAEELDLPAAVDSSPAAHA